MDISENKPKDRSYLFQPGQVANPTGRPKEVAHVKELARKWTTEAIETLAAIMQDKREKASARVAAANALLDRGYGRAPLTFDEPPEQAVDLREAARRLAFLMNGAILRGETSVIDVQAVEIPVDALALAGAVVESRERKQAAVVERKAQAKAARDNPIES